MTELIRNRHYGWGTWHQQNIISGWFGASTQGLGLDLWDIDGSGRPDMIVFQIDNPDGENVGYYRIGWNLNQLGYVERWSQPIAIPGWFGAEDQGGGLAIADLNRNGRPDLVVFHIDNPDGENQGYYRIGWDLDIEGNVTSGWSEAKPIPGWFGAENQDGDIAIADVSGNGTLDLIVFHIDNPSGENRGYYRIGWDLDAEGNVSGGWSDIKPIPGWFGAENQGAGLAIIHDYPNLYLVVSHIDNPTGKNQGYYRMCRLDQSGNPASGWTDPYDMSTTGSIGRENQGLEIATYHVTGYYRPELICLYVDASFRGDKRAYYYMAESLIDLP